MKMRTFLLFMLAAVASTTHALPVAPRNIVEHTAEYVSEAMIETASNFQVPPIASAITLKRSYPLSENVKEAALKEKEFAEWINVPENAAWVKWKEELDAV
jgi:hypothetical protein